MAKVYYSPVTSPSTKMGNLFLLQGYIVEKRVFCLHIVADSLSYKSPTSFSSHKMFPPLIAPLMPAFVNEGTAKARPISEQDREARSWRPLNGLLLQSHYPQPNNTGSFWIEGGINSPLRPSIIKIRKTIFIINIERVYH